MIIMMMVVVMVVELLNRWTSNLYNTYNTPAFVTPFHKGLMSLLPSMSVSLQPQYFTMKNTSGLLIGHSQQHGCGLFLQFLQHSIINPLMGTLKLQSSIQQFGDWYTDRWWVGCPVLHLVQQGVAWAGSAIYSTLKPQDTRIPEVQKPIQAPPRCTKCNSPPINGQCTNFLLFDVAL